MCPSCLYYNVQSLNTQLSPTLILSLSPTFSLSLPHLMVSAWSSWRHLLFILESFSL